MKSLFFMMISSLLAVDVIEKLREMLSYKEESFLFKPPV